MLVDIPLRNMDLHCSIFAGSYTDWQSAPGHLATILHSGHTPPTGTVAATALLSFSREQATQHSVACPVCFEGCPETCPPLPTELLGYVLQSVQGCLGCFDMV